MTQTSQLPVTTEEGKAQAAAHDAARPEPKQFDALHTEHGDTTIADQVVVKLAGLAAREVPGVYAMGSAAGRAVTSLTNRIPGAKQNVSGGVSVEKGERQAAIAVSVVVEYGVSIVDVGNSIRDGIISAVEYATGLEVVEVNINVSDVHLPDEDTDTDVADQGSDRLQ